MSRRVTGSWVKGTAKLGPSKANGVMNGLWSGAAVNPRFEGSCESSSEAGSCSPPAFAVGRSSEGVGTARPHSAEAAPTGRGGPWVREVVPRPTSARASVESPSTVWAPGPWEACPAVQQHWASLKGVQLSEGAQQRFKGVLRAVRASAESAEQSADCAVEEGQRLADFELFLAATAPVVRLGAAEAESLVGSPSAPAWNGDLRFEELAQVPLRQLWDWYEAPSALGVQVDLSGFAADTVQAFFVPYLSAIQLFGYASPCLQAAWAPSVPSGALPAGVQELLHAVEGVGVSREVLAGAAERLRPGGQAASSAAGSSQRQGDGGEGARRRGSRRHTVAPCLLYEFFESDPPYNRQPLLDRLVDLSLDPIGSGRGKGDPAALMAANLTQLHPASWFAVAWYPIYRIPGGPLRSAFLTFHSFGYMDTEDQCGALLGLKVSNSGVRHFRLPAAGLQWYNTMAKGEHWLNLSPGLGGIEDGVDEARVAELGLVLGNRLRTLTATAAAMARQGFYSGAGRTHNGPHSDYEFFVGRQYGR